MCPPPPLFRTKSFLTSTDAHIKMQKEAHGTKHSPEQFLAHKNKVSVSKTFVILTNLFHFFN